MISNRLWHRLIAALMVFSVGFSPIAPVHAQTQKNSSAPTPEFLVVAAGDESYRVVESKNANGRVVRQMLIGQERREISIDKNGDGFLDGWIMVTPASTVEMKQAFAGQFQLMDVEHRLEKESVQMKFMLNSKSGLYSLYEARRVPHRTMYKSTFIVGCEGANSAQMHEDASELRKFIAANDSNATSLKVSLVKNLFPDKCKEAPFDDSVEALASGLVEVAKSDRYDSEKNGTPPEKGKFLQCLRYFDMDYHAAKIAAAIEEFRLGRPTRPSWQLRCEKSSQKNQLGSYSSGSVPPTVAILKTKDSIPFVAGPGDNGDEFFSNAYGAVFFHELLHYSGIDDTMAYDIEECCSKEAGEGGRACNAVAKLVRTQKYAQMHRAGLNQELETRNSNYGVLRDTQRAILGSAADDIVDEFERDVGALYDKYANMEQCHKGESKRVYGTCGTAFMEEFRELVDTSFQVEGCPTAARNQYTAQYTRGLPNGLGPEQRAELREKAANYAVKVCARLRGLLKSIYESDPGACNDICSDTITKEVQDPFFKTTGGSSLVRWVLGLSRADAVIGSKETQQDTSIWSSSAPDRLCEMCIRKTSEANSGDESGPIHTIGWGVTQRPPAEARTNIGDEAKITIGMTDKNECIGLNDSQVGLNRFCAKADEPKNISDESKIANETTTNRLPQERFPSSLEGGPRRFNYGRDSSNQIQRERELVEHIERSNSVVQVTKSFAMRAASEVLPRAQASTIGTRDPQASSSKGKIANLNPSKNAEGVSSRSPPSVPINTGQFSIPGPFGVSPQSGMAKSGSGSTVKPQQANISSSGDQGLRASGNRQGANPASAAGAGGQALRAPSGTSGAPRLPARQVAGLNKQEVTQVDEFLKKLMGPYSEVKELIRRPDTVARMIQYRIQVVDDRGAVHGASNPSYVLRYEPKLRRLNLKDNRDM